MPDYTYTLMAKLLKFILYKIFPNIIIRTHDEPIYRTTTVRLKNRYRTTFAFITRGFKDGREFTVEHVIKHL